MKMLQKWFTLLFEVITLSPRVYHLDMTFVYIQHLPPCKKSMSVLMETSDNVFFFTVAVITVSLPNLFSQLTVKMYMYVLKRNKVSRTEYSWSCRHSYYEPLSLSIPEIQAVYLSNLPDFLPLIWSIRN